MTKTLSDESSIGLGADKVSGPYKYPLDNTNKHLTKISFQAMKVLPPEISVNYQAKPVFQGPEDRGALSRSGIETGGVTSTGLKVRSIVGEKADIHIPISFQVNDGFNYAGTELGAFGGAITNVLNRGGSVSAAALEGLGELGASFLSVLSAFGGSEQELGRLGVTRLARGLPVGSNAVQVGARVSVNPNVRTQFQNVSPREFNFSFKFIPVSFEESKQVKAIINFFRFHAYPELIGDTNFALGYEYPNMFRIKLLFTGEGGPKNIGTPIKLSYLKTVSTTYNPTSTTVFSDGSPTEIDMNLTFAEYKAQSRNDIKEQEKSSYYDFEGVSDENETTRETPSGEFTSTSATTPEGAPS
jgi:hypothetical protein